MITLYYGISSVSSRRAVAWFESRNIDFCKKRVDRMSRDDLVHLLSLSENGFADILKNPKKARENYLEQLQYLEGLNFNRSVDFLIEHPYLLKVPLICERKKLMIGYNEENIRMFLPKKHRDLKLSLDQL